MKRVIGMLAVLALVATTVLANEEAKDLTLKGKLTKADKDGKVTYTLTTDAGDVAVPAPAAGSAVKLDDVVGADVEMAVKGTEADQNGKKVVTIKEVVSVKKVEAAAAAAN